MIGSWVPLIEQPHPDSLLCRGSRWIRGSFHRCYLLPNTSVYLQGCHLKGVSFWCACQGTDNWAEISNRGLAVAKCNVLFLEQNCLFVQADRALIPPLLSFATQAHPRVWWVQALAHLNYAEIILLWSSADLLLTWEYIRKKGEKKFFGFIYFGHFSRCGCLLKKAPPITQSCLTQVQSFSLKVLSKFT